MYNGADDVCGRERERACRWVRRTNAGGNLMRSAISFFFFCRGFFKGARMRIIPKVVINAGRC